MTLAAYYEAYKGQAASPELAAAALAELRKFEQHCIRKRWVSLKGLKLNNAAAAGAGAGAAAVAPDSLAADVHSEQVFVRKLLVVLINQPKTKAWNQEPIASILAYFHLRAARGNEVAAEIVEIMKVHAGPAAQLLEFRKLLQTYYRDPLRIEHKFHRLGRDLIPRTDMARPKAAADLKAEILARINATTAVDREAPIALDGTASRSVIIAINQAIKELQAIPRADLGHIRFQIGTTRLRYEPAGNHGRGKIVMEYQRAAGGWFDGTTPKWADVKAAYYDHYGYGGSAAYNAYRANYVRNKVLHSYPYGTSTESTDLPRMLAALAARLRPGLTLAQLFRDRFSANIQPITQADFTPGIPVEELHFLNAFGFLTTIYEPARYLLDALDTSDASDADGPRPITDRPISTALAVSKHLWETGASLTDMFAECPPAFKASHKHTPFRAPTDGRSG